MEEFFPINIEFLLPEKINDFPLWLKIKDRWTLYKSANLRISKIEFDSLLQRSIDLWVKKEHEKSFLKASESALPNILRSESINIEKKTELLYKVASHLMQDVLENPRADGIIPRTKEFTKNNIDFLSKEKNAFMHMVSLTSRDYYTYTHCINVSTFSLGLAMKLGSYDSKQLNILGQGALLHDIGKAEIDIAILNKPGKLNDDEWTIMKKHPVFGYDTVRDNPSIHDIVKNIIVQHHERPDGSGYPYGLINEQIHPFSKIVSICDVFDAITTNRPYKKAATSFEALKIMKDFLSKNFDTFLFKQFLMLMMSKEKH